MTRGTVHSVAAVCGRSLPHTQLPTAAHVPVSWLSTAAPKAVPAEQTAQPVTVTGDSQRTALHVALGSSTIRGVIQSARTHAHKSTYMHVKAVPTQVRGR